MGVVTNPWKDVLGQIEQGKELGKQQVSSRE